MKTLAEKLFALTLEGSQDDSWFEHKGFEISLSHESGLGRGVQIWKRDVEDPGRLSRMPTVAKERRYGSKEWSPAEINWSAWGAQPVEVTRIYRDAMNLALEIAETWDTAEADGEMWNPPADRSGSK